VNKSIKNLKSKEELLPIVQKMMAFTLDNPNFNLLSSLEEFDETTKKNLAEQYLEIMHQLAVHSQCEEEFEKLRNEMMLRIFSKILNN
jgi:CRISPR/Cas system endoribonuclease Cas6 (RAMP superfamily)